MRRLLPLALGFSLVVVSESAAQQPEPAAPIPPLRGLDGLTWTLPPADPRQPRPSVFAIESALTCPGCAPDATAPPRNPNAPWTLRVGVRFGDDERGALSATLVGQRGASAPLYVQGPIDAAGRTTPSSWVTMGDTRTRWDLVLAGERAMARLPGGPAISVAGEWFVPLGTTGAAVPGNAPAGSGSAFWLGVRSR